MVAHLPLRGTAPGAGEPTKRGRSCGAVPSFFARPSFTSWTWEAEAALRGIQGDISQMEATLMVDQMVDDGCLPLLHGL